MSRAEQKQEAGRFLEFRDLEELAEYARAWTAASAARS